MDENGASLRPATTQQIEYRVPLKSVHVTENYVLMLAANHLNTLTQLLTEVGPRLSEHQLIFGAQSEGVCGQTP